MGQNYQKTANSLRELQLPHPGILGAKDFHEHFELHCYEPSPDLQPFVTHIWTQRQRGRGRLRHKPVEVLSGPNMYLFITAESAFIHGITPHRFEYDPAVTGVIAGVKFRPGGLYSFLHQPIAHQIPVAAVFPDVDMMFRHKLLTQPDTQIVAMLETLLLDRRPVPDKNLDLVTHIMETLERDPSLQTVDAVARAFDMSSRSLQLLFQTRVGVGLKWVLTRRRLLETVGRVQSTPHVSWTEAAVESGYSSQSHFSRQFKQSTGLSPAEYLRASH